MSRVWFITGAGSGIGAGVGRAALKAGHRIVATGRNMGKLSGAFATVAIGKPSITFQTMSCPSSLPDASSCPSPRQLSDVIESLWSASVPARPPAALSHR